VFFDDSFKHCLAAFKQIDAFGMIIYLVFDSIII